MTIDREKLKALAEAARDYSGSDLIEHESRYNALAYEVDPAAVLALLAEIEEDAMHMRAFGEVMRAQAEQLDQLKAENERLTGEVNRLRAKHGDFSTGPGAEDAPYLFSVSRDRMGCTVDFNGTPHHYIEMSEGCVSCGCGDMYRDDSYGAGFMAANNGVCENCDAAMSKGEQP